jgi:lipopolysaccharide transport system ATP-binding protein
MSDTIIRVENLSKKYIIGHQPEESYTALRDVIANRVKSVGSLIKNPKAKIQNFHEDFWALKDLSFEVQRGERIGIIGRNGAGKSTLLKILSRITEPTKGRISIKGRIASLLEVGTGFHPELTGRENIYLNGAILGMGKVEIQRKFDEIVAFSEVEKFLDTPVKRYSSGMYVRLAFAVAAFLESEILVVDEVLAVGDIEFQKKCIGRMEDVTKSGKTVLFVSHNTAAISLLCQKGIYLEKGQLITIGEIAKCIDLYTQNQGQRSGNILEHQRVKAPGLKAIGVKINGNFEDRMYVASTSENLEIELTFVADSKCRVSLFGSLKDSQGQSIGIYSPGHVGEDVYTVNPGQHKLLGKVFLPKLNKGRYFLELGLVDPGVQFYIYFPFGVELDVAGTPTKSGVVYEQGINDVGYQIIDGYSSLERDILSPTTSSYS